jgi:hypothetical protein
VGRDREDGNEKTRIKIWVGSRRSAQAEAARLKRDTFFHDAEVGEYLEGVDAWEIVWSAAAPTDVPGWEMQPVEEPMTRESDL